MLLAAEIWGVNTEILQRLHVDQRGCIGAAGRCSHTAQICMAMAAPQRQLQRAGMNR